MRVITCLLIILSFLSFNLMGKDLVTRSGKKFTNYTVERVSAKGVLIFHDTGGATIPLKDLPDDICKQYQDQYDKIVRKKVKKLARIKSSNKLKAISRKIHLKIYMHKGSGKYLCSWSKNQVEYKSIKEALKHASKSQMDDYIRDKKRVADKERDLTKKYNRTFAVAYTKKNNTKNHVSSWIYSMNNALDRSYDSYPINNIIFVEGLPDNLVDRATWSGFVYKVGIITIRNSRYIKYTINKKYATKYIKK